jgi:hypothetical protein
MRHDPKPDEARGYQADRKYELVEKNELPAPAPGQLLINKAATDLAAEPDPCTSGTPTANCNPRPARRRGSSPRRAIDQTIAVIRPWPPATQPNTSAPSNCPRKPAEISHPIGCGASFQSGAMTAHRSDRERIEGIKEGGSADDDPCLDLPPGRGQALDLRNDFVDR